MTSQRGIAHAQYIIYLCIWPFTCLFIHISQPFSPLLFEFALCLVFLRSTRRIDDGEIQVNPLTPCIFPYISRLCRYSMISISMLHWSHFSFLLLSTDWGSLFSLNVKTMLFSNRPEAVSIPVLPVG
uniref:Uncharacterized protein n=1 Tax=Cacopsylla melanoneura TaxID=428564 RepID=A0A8D8VZN0_9HEMI